MPGAPASRGDGASSTSTRTLVVSRDEEGTTYRLFARVVLPFEPEAGYGVELPE